MLSGQRPRRNTSQVKDVIVVANKEIQHLDKSQVKLSVTVRKDDAEKEYRKLLAEYSGKAQISGFRRGKVPAEVLERKFGEGIKVEAGQQIIEDSLKEIFSEIEEKPLPYSVPELQDDLEFSFDKDFCFSVTYDIYPKIEVGPYTGLTVEQPEVDVTEDDEKRELDALVEQNSFIVEKDGAAAKDDSATVNYWEVDDQGNEIPNTKRQDFTFVVGSGYNHYKFDDDVVGMKKGDKKTVKKDFPADFETKELAGTSKTLVIELAALKEKKRPELNDELAQDISDKYETLDDLKKDIRKRLEETAADRTRALTIEALMEQVAEKSSLELPESMVQAELDHSWHHFVSQFRMKPDQVEKLLQLQGRSRETLFQDWRPNAEKSLKVRLLIEKMIETEKIEASEDEIDSLLKTQGEGSSMKFDELKDYYKKNNLLDMVGHDVKEKKLFDAVLAKNTLTKGRKLNFMDAMQGNR